MNGKSKGFKLLEMTRHLLQSELDDMSVRDAMADKAVGKAEEAARMAILLMPPLTMGDVVAKLSEALTMLDIDENISPETAHSIRQARDFLSVQTDEVAA